MLYIVLQKQAIARLDKVFFCGTVIGMSPRPPKASVEKKSKALQVRLTPGQMIAVEKAAQAEMLEVSTWARVQLLKAAGYKPSKP